ncbi:hypothetical protein LPJ53_003261 [Coemansia erecta]|uniref:WD40 repeat-like protein n=1 Tax=Coemansia erecta TaxID=147472 RepID=A0A9W7XWK9_9FUNG|nr:hypothetical protein LPJ53_003261 [Coemansia erecta]
MSDPKRVRLSDSDDCGDRGGDNSTGESNGTGRAQKFSAEFALLAQNTVVLPSGIGSISALATYSRDAREYGNVNAEGDMEDGAVQDLIPKIAIGTDTGYVALISDDGKATVLEHSGNPAIQRLLVTKSTSGSTALSKDALVPDVISGDSDGRVTVFTMGRMISRVTLSAPVSAIAFDENPNTPRSFIVGDMSGTVTAGHTQGILWRAQTDTSISESSRLNKNGIRDPGITSVCAVRFTDDHGMLTSYVLTATENNHIQLLSRGFPVLTVPVSAQCSCMCTGVFYLQKKPASHKLATQAIIGDDAGWLHVLDSFKMTPFAQVDYPVTSVVAIPLRAFVNQDGPDVVVCATRSNMLYVLHAKRIVGTYAADFWPAAMEVYIPASSEMSPTILIAENKVVGNQNAVCLLHKISLSLSESNKE